MAAELPEIAEDNQPITDREIRGRFDHLDAIVHAIHAEVERLAALASPEARALLDSYLKNPAVRWKARRNGGKTIQ